MHPLPGSLIRQVLLRCAEECFHCAASCIACADVSLSENDQELIRVIRVALDCADACEVTGRIAVRQSAPDIRLIRGVIEGCAAACPETMAGVGDDGRASAPFRRPLARPVDSVVQQADHDSQQRDRCAVRLWLGCGRGAERGRGTTTQLGAQPPVSSPAASADGAAFNTGARVEAGFASARRSRPRGAKTAGGRRVLASVTALAAQDRTARTRRTPRRLNSSAAPNRR